MSLGQSKFWCFTINNPKKNYKDLDGLKKWDYLVVGNEIGEHGTPHLQCFIAFKTRTKFSTIKNQLPRAHIEKMMGNPKQASTYCMKDGNYEIFGELPDYSGGATGGEKKAINYRRIIDLAETSDFNTIKEENPGLYFRHYPTIKRIAMDNPVMPEDNDELKNEWIWGKTGLGKSKTARKENPGYYIKSHNKWWMGYRGEKVAIIDDISRTEATWLGEHLKQWSDHYSFPSETKGDGKVIRPEKIVCTSNYSIETLWGHDEDLCESIKRRFKVRHFVEPFPKKVSSPIVIEDGYDSDISSIP